MMEPCQIHGIPYQVVYTGDNVVGYCQVCMTNWRNLDRNEKPSHDPVNNPQHYSKQKYQPIDVAEDWSKDLIGLEAYCVGNILKYIARYKYKNGLEDLKKAQWYVNKLVDYLEE
jgi:hypothetical protein